MLALITALALSQVTVLQDGVTLGTATRINCTGGGVTCSKIGATSTVKLNVTPGGGGGAPTTALYWTGAADATLSAEKDLSALSTGLVINTAGTPSAYAGASCSNQFPRSLNASGAPTCASVNAALDVTGLLPVANGGLGLGAPVDDAIPVGTAGLIYAPAVLPACLDASGKHLNYDATTNTFSCGTSSSSAGNFGTFTVTFGSGALSRYDSDVATVTAAWVAAGSAIFLTPKCATTVGGNTVDNCLISKLECSVVAIVAGTSFDVQCMAPFTASGSYTISYTGG